MQQRRSGRENGRQTGGQRRPAGVDTARGPAAHVHGACREAVDCPLGPFEAGWLIRRPCVLVHCTWLAHVMFYIPEMALLTNEPRAPARDAIHECVGLFESGGSGHSQGQTARGVGEAQRTTQAAAADRNNKQQ